MKKVLNLYKPAGATPLEAIKKFKLQNSAYKDIKMTYAGRLDPMAEGVLLVLSGDELKDQKKYWRLDKEYEAEILFGFSTDTYDILGLPLVGFADPSFKVPASPRSSGSARLRSQRKIKRFTEVKRLNQAFALPRATLKKDRLRQLVEDFKGEYTFPLPPYSSQKIQGKPLFWWARAGKLGEIDIPKKTVTIKKIKLLEVREIKKEVLLKQILSKIDLVQGDFRQEEIKKAWEEVFGEVRETEFYIAKIKIKCSSGTYIRAIAQELGQTLGCGAVLFSLARTRVGKHTVKKSQLLK